MVSVYFANVDCDKFTLNQEGGGIVKAEKLVKNRTLFRYFLF